MGRNVSKPVKPKRDYGKQRVLEMTQEELEQYLYYYHVKTARDLFDWNGCKPIINEHFMVVGVIFDNCEQHDCLEYVEEWDSWRIAL